jgi:hypothetical protein
VPVPLAGRDADRLQAAPGNTWRLHVLDLASGRETALAETRSVDDQVEWLDDERIMYGLAGDVWVVPADGGGKPRVYIPDALARGRSLVNSRLHWLHQRL